MEYSPSFLLRVAMSLIEEATQGMEPALNALRQESADAAALVRELKSDLGRAIELAEKAAKDADDEEKQLGLSLLSNAHFKLGVLAMRTGDFQSAIKHFEESNRVLNNQESLYNMALAYLQMKGWFKDNTPRAVEAFRRCIELDPQSDLAVAAGKRLARLGAL